MTPKNKYKDIIKATHHDIFNGVIFNTKAELVKALKKEMKICIQYMKDIDNEYPAHELTSERITDYVKYQKRDVDYQIYILDCAIVGVKEDMMKMPIQIIPSRKLLNQIWAATISPGTRLYKKLKADQVNAR